MLQQRTRWALATILLLLGPAVLRAVVVLAPATLPLQGLDGTRQRWPAVAVGPSGELLAWEEDTHGVLVRSLDAAGLPGPPRMVAANDPLPAQIPFDVKVRENHEPAIARRPDGSYLVVWTEEMVDHEADIFIDQTRLLSSRVVARLFRPDGTPATALPIEIGNGTGFAGRAAVVASNDGWWVAWEEVGGSSPAVRVRRVDRRGKLGKPAVVAAGGMRPAIAAAGGFVGLAWERTLADDVTTQVCARLYRASGRPLGAVLALEQIPGRSASMATVAGLPTGSFLVGWESFAELPTPQHSVAAQLLSRAGTRLGAELTLAGSATAGAGAPALVASPDGGWIATWVGRTPGRDGVSLGTFDAFGAPTATAIALTGEALLKDDHALAIGAGGRLLAAWVGRDESALVSIRGRLAQVAATPPR